VLLAALGAPAVGCKGPATAQPLTLEDPSAPLLDTDLQALIDSAEDDSVVLIPRGRYVLAEGLVVRERTGLILRCEKGAQILAENVNDNILTFEKCHDVRLENAYLRHFEPLREYECHGYVVSIRDSDNITIANCEVNGCGAVGVSARTSSRLTIRDSFIHHNTFNAFYLSKCGQVLIRGCVIEDNANLCQVYGTDDLEMSDNLIRRNGGYWRDKDPHPGLKE